MGAAATTIPGGSDSRTHGSVGRLAFRDMRLLLAVDAIRANKAGIGVLDLGSGRWEHFQEIPIDEGFRRRGFRGAHLHGDDLYAVNSAAVYRLRLEREPSWNVTVEAVHRRPEWELGERAAADLHDICISERRERIIVANSFMDTIDELSMDGQLVERRYLWDICPEIAELALTRNFDAADLVHVNHVVEHDGELLATLGNVNGTRTGAVLNVDTGELLVTDLPFPHDGVFASDGFYVSFSETGEIAVYDATSSRGLPDAALTRIPVTIRQPFWADSFQWVRGIAVTEHHLVCGVTQWRKESPGRSQIPPRIVVYSRHDHSFVGELFLPPIDDFPVPAIFSVIVLDGDSDRLDGAAWKEPEPPAHEVVSPDRVVPIAGWTPPSDRTGAVVARPDGGTEVTVSAKARFYVKDTPGDFGDPPEASALGPAELRAGTTTAIDCQIDGELAVHLWVIYYDDHERLSHDTLRLRRGHNVLHHDVPAGATRCRYAVRVDGIGTTSLSPLSIATPN